MLIGYARVSTQDQTLDLQTDALKRAGCEKLFTDTVSGAKAERSGLHEAMSHLRAGDTLVVWRLDRLGRTLKHLIATVTDLSERGIGFKSLQENIDTTTSGGKLIFHIFGALAEFEREVIRERTNAGLQAARARGRLGGRPTIQSLDPKKVALAKKLYADKTMPVQEICATLRIGRSTLYRYIREAHRTPHTFERQSSGQWRAPRHRLAAPDAAVPRRPLSRFQRTNEHMTGLQAQARSSNDQTGGARDWNLCD